MVERGEIQGQLQGQNLATRNEALEVGDEVKLCVHMPTNIKDRYKP